MTRTIVIDLSQDINVIWYDIQHRRRNFISKAEKLGIIIEEGMTHFDEWYPLYVELYTRLGCKVLGQADLRRNIENDTVWNKGPFFVGIYNGEVLVGEWYRIFENGIRIRQKLTASKRFGPDKKKNDLAARAHALLIWNVIKWAKEHRLKFYDFGGYVPEEEATRSNAEWKQRFGGKIVIQKTLYGTGDEYFEDDFKQTTP